MKESKEYQSLKDVSIQDLSQGYLVKKSEEVVLLIHGFGGSPAELTLLASALIDGGYSVYAPLLTGHGTKIEDEDHTKYQSWIQDVDEAYSLLKSQYKKVFISGLSMGGLLALHLAEVDKVEALALMAPAIVYYSSSNYMAFLILPFKKHLSFFGKTEFEGHTESYLRGGYNMVSVSASLELNKLQKTVRKDLGQITSPYLVIQGKKDTLVSPKEPEYLAKRTRSEIKEVIYLESSSHLIPLDNERNTAFKAIIEFFKKH